MTSTRTWPLGPVALFLILTAALCTVELSILADPRFLVRPDLIAGAATLDLAAGLPALGYLCLVRTRRVGVWLTVPLFFLGVALARWWIPTPRQGVLHGLEWLVAAAELGIVAFLVLRLRRVHALYRSRRDDSLYPLDATRTAVSETLHSRLAAEVVLTELAVLYYAVSGWWTGAPTTHPRGAVFPCHRRGGYPALLGALLLVTAVEIPALHFLLALWSGWVAWIATGLGVYGFLWLLGDFQAMRLQPTVASAAGLHLRLGLRWRAYVPWSALRALHPGRTVPSSAKLRMTPFGTPDLWLELHEPVVVRGLLGIERRVRWLGVGVEDREGLRALVRLRAPGLSEIRSSPSAAPEVDHPHDREGVDQSVKHDRRE